jgi:hypothetical protein
MGHKLLVRLVQEMAGVVGMVEWIEQDQVQIKTQ